MGLITDTNQTYYEGTNIGGYQFISLDDIINNFMMIYVGPDKTISKVKRTDVAFHAQRALQEFSYDVLKSIKTQEIDVPPNLLMLLPQDYVNYSKVFWVDSSGVERTIYPIRKSSNPVSIVQDSGYNYTYDGSGNLILANESRMWELFKANDGTVNQDQVDIDQDTYALSVEGQRYGIDPEFANSNGGFYIDEVEGKIHFSAGLTGKTVVIRYVSDGLGSDAEMVVHKFAEKAMYAQISFAVLSIKKEVPKYSIDQARKDAFAAKRLAKLRLSSIKMEELTQIMRGKSTQIKH